ncbi:hypothetical protein GSI_14245 [Ganoderma sinense ZZ0214-1]|uniref:Retrotransposon gag domain-containing protein n=1 Tax=Ganoderma sinense ZZ0214-1 TaxID=1077348 RepID=A0A2G8RSK3_9APHY|nr:hypothetical protein GSI_14245 [Ganoderma sinense ZZ0214-1]
MDPWEQLLASYVAPHQYPSPTPSPPPVLRAIYAREAREARSAQDNRIVSSKNPQTSGLMHSSLTTVSTAVHNNPALTDTTAETPSTSAHQTPGSTQSRASRQQNKHQDQQLRYLERLLHELVHVSRPLSPSNAPEAHIHAPVQNDTESHPLLPHVSPPPSKPQNLQKRPRSPEAADWTTESQPKIPPSPDLTSIPDLSTIRNHPVVIDLTRTDSTQALGNLGLHATPAPTAQDPVQPARIRQSPRPNRAMSQEFSLDQATQEWIQHEIADVFTRLCPPTTGRKHAAPRLAPPEYFDGISPDFEQWKSDVQVYVAGLDKDAAISAVLGLIRGTNVNRWKRNLTQDKFVANGNSWNYTDIAAFWAELTTKFRPINYVNDAIIALDQIHMGSRRAEDFFDEWEDLASRASENKDTPNNIYQLKNALPSGYLVAISTMPTKPATYAEWKNTIINMDNDRIIFNRQIHDFTRRPPPQRPLPRPPPRYSQPQYAPPRYPPPRPQYVPRAPQYAPRPAPQYYQPQYPPPRPYYPQRPQMPMMPGDRRTGTGVTYGGAGQPMDIDRLNARPCRKCGAKKTEKGTCGDMWHIPNRTGTAALQKRRWEERDSREEFLEEIRRFYQEDPEDFLAQTTGMEIPSYCEEPGPPMEHPTEGYVDNYDEIRDQMDDYEQHFPYGPT